MMRVAGLSVFCILLGSLLIAEDKTIVVVEKSTSVNDKTNDVENSKNLPAGASAVTASSLDDAATKILGKVGAGDCIKRLDFRGHGGPGVQGVGDGVNYDADKHIDTGAAKWKEKLAGLKGKFCADAVINLWGCNTGSCDKGASKLKELADFFGVTARGAVNKVNAGQQEKYTGPIQEAKPNQPKPEHKASTQDKAPKKPQQKCDVNQDGDIDITDITTIFNARNIATSPDDVRDTDSDGTITVNDARLCVQMCTRPLCAR